MLLASRSRSPVDGASSREMRAADGRLGAVPEHDGPNQIPSTLLFRDGVLRGSRMGAQTLDALVAMTRRRWRLAARIRRKLMEHGSLSPMRFF